MSHSTHSILSPTLFSFKLININPNHLNDPMKMILSMIDVIVTVVWDSDVIIRLPSRTSCVVCVLHCERES